MEYPYYGEKAADETARGGGGDGEGMVASFDRSPVEYVQRLHHGVVMLQVIIIMSFVMMFLMFAYLIGAAAIRGVPANGHVPESSSPWLMLPFWGLSVVNVWAVWLLTTREKGLAIDEGETWRLCWRQLTVVAFVFGVAGLIVEFATAPGGLPLVMLAMTGVSMGLGLATFIVQMNYQAWIGARLGDSRVYWRAKKLRWQGPLLCTVGILLLGAGPIIALVLYWNLQTWTREGLNRVMARG